MRLRIGRGTCSPNAPDLPPAATNINTVNNFNQISMGMSAGVGSTSFGLDRQIVVVLGYSVTLALALAQVHQERPRSSTMLSTMLTMYYAECTKCTMPFFMKYPL